MEGDALWVVSFAIGRDELVGGTVCPPHESIKFRVTLAKLLEVFGRVLAFCEGFNYINDAEIVGLEMLVPMFA